MRGPMRNQVFAMLVAGLTALGCAASEPVTRTPGPSTAGGEATAVPVVARGNEPSARMAVADRPPPPYVDPKTVSSEPSPLVQQPTPKPAPAQAPTYVAAQPPAPRPEAYPTQTSTAWVWAPGYWYWHGGQYVWISGTWIPARRGHVYVSARWVHAGHRGWMFVPGGWALSTYDPIVYPVYPYDPFYYRHYHGYFHHPYHHHHGYGHHRHPSRDRLFIRPDGGRDFGRSRSSSRLRVRAR